MTTRLVLLVDEAQELQPAVLAELRLLASADLDSHILLTTVLAGDGRLTDRLCSDEFLPLASRMRERLAIERTPPQDLQDCLRHALQQAGAPTLMTPEVIAAICDHPSAGIPSAKPMEPWPATPRAIPGP
jgi:general secretion pathway protein A